MSTVVLQQPCEQGCWHPPALSGDPHHSRVQVVVNSAVAKGTLLVLHGQYPPADSTHLQHGFFTAPKKACSLLPWSSYLDYPNPNPNPTYIPSRRAFKFTTGRAVEYAQPSHLCRTEGGARD